MHNADSSGYANAGCSTGGAGFGFKGGGGKQIGRGGSEGGYGSSGSGPRSERAASGKAVTPERPRYRRGSERSPVYNRRSSTAGGTCTPTPNGGAMLSVSPPLGGGGGGFGRGPSVRIQHFADGGGRGGGFGSGLNLRGREEGGVRVAVRVRPLTVEEEAGGGERTIRCCNPKTIELLSTPITPTSSRRGGIGGGDCSGSHGGEGGSGGEEIQAYHFDLCAHEGFNQAEMFESCGLKKLLSAAVEGYAGTVFAYGATGAGKTYTMSGREQIMREINFASNGGGRSRSNSARSDSNGDTDGLITRSMRYIFEEIAALPEGVKMRVRASFYEIYNELVYDLLDQRGRRPLQTRYDVKHGFFVQGLFEIEIRGLKDIMAVMDEGNSNRRVSSHLLNKDSSRSHSLLSLYLQSEWKHPEDGHLVKRFGKVSFVDLAGSERLKKSRALDGKETGSINRSLMTLGKVISALSRRSAVAASAAAAAAAATPTSMVSTGLSGVPNPMTPGADSNSSSTNNTAGVYPADIWVPYRDSTLTKLLMDSLGGNGLTLMVACVSPAARHAEESVATLNYAARAKNIRNRPLARIDAREKLIDNLRREINLLREENALLRQARIVSPVNSITNRDVVGGEIAHRRGGGETEGGGEYAGERGDGVMDWLDQMAPGGMPHLCDRRGGWGDVGGGGGAAMAAGGVGVEEAKMPVSASLEDGAQAAFQIGQAGRDVAVLLRKYEEECHHLRKEAALAQQKEQEMGTQTRQTLMENEALSKTVERLRRRDFGKAVGVDDERLDEGGRGAGSFGGTDQTMGMAARTTVGDAESEVLHLRRVNEALVERLEGMERSQLGSLAGRSRRSTDGKRSEPDPSVLLRGENEEPAAVAEREETAAAAPIEQLVEDEKPDEPSPLQGSGGDNENGDKRFPTSDGKNNGDVGDGGEAGNESEDELDDYGTPKYVGLIRDFEDVRETETRQKKKIMAAAKIRLMQAM